MPLIKCPECGKEISSYASSCPNCGCPAARFNKKQTNTFVTTDCKNCEWYGEYYTESFFGLGNNKHTGCTLKNKKIFGNPAPSCATFHPKGK